MDEQELERILTLIFDRLESLADQNEDTARRISAIRGAAKLTPGFEARYDKLYSEFLGLAANKTADSEVQEIRKLLVQALRPKP